VQEIHSLGGPALLIMSAMDAVKQWVYRPTLLNGQPVQVETTIDVNFTLNQ
jgi:protein TonB